MTPARLAVLILLTLVAVAIALLLQRRRSEPPSAPSYRAPQQLDRADFREPAARLLVVMFSSATCNSCPAAWATIEHVAGEWDAPGELAVQRIDVQDDPDLHTRYRIDGVPTTIVADADGVVGQAFFGPVEAESVRTALAGLS
ncbi:MAG: thioredoxin family protein [Acidimicrobiia bacterium]|nr:thioredoxin family protein [Acidimicrobiia bacterium]